MTRYVVVARYDGGGEECFGPWRTPEPAERVADQLRSQSARYNPDDELADFEVAVVTLLTWPGIRAYQRST